MNLKTVFGALVAGLLLTGAGFFGWKALAHASPAERRVRAARNLERSGQTVAAAREWLLATSLDPRLAEAREKLGKAFLREGATAFAIREFQACARLQPHRPHAYCQLAEALQAGGLTGDALRFAQYATKTEPDCPRAARVLGTLLLARADDQGGVTALERAARLDPEDAISRRALAERALLQQDSASAERWAREALRCAPEDPQARYTLASALLARAESTGQVPGKLPNPSSEPAGTGRSEAETLLRQVTAAAPDFVPARKQLAGIYRAQHRLLAARWELEHVVRVAPGDLEATGQLAELLDGLKDPVHAAEQRRRADEIRRQETAREELERQLAARPTDGQLMVRIAHMYAAAGKGERALELLKRARDFVPAGTALAAQVDQMTGALHSGTTSGPG